MSYDLFLSVMSQLTERRKAQCVVQGSVIFIESKPKPGKWTFSTCVFNGDGNLHHSIKECVSSSGVLRWQERGAKLHLDLPSHSIYLKQEFNSEPKYVPFRYMMCDFADVASEWKEILEEFSSRDHTSIRLV